MGAGAGASGATFSMTAGLTIGIPGNGANTLGAKVARISSFDLESAEEA